jgi:hypothetical protein
LKKLVSLKITSKLMKDLKQYLSKNFFCHLAEDDVEGGNVIAVTTGVPELGLLVEPAAARLGRIKQTFRNPNFTV